MPDQFILPGDLQTKLTLYEQLADGMAVYVARLVYHRRELLIASSV